MKLTLRRALPGLVFTVGVLLVLLGVLLIALACAGNMWLNGGALNA